MSIEKKSYVIIKEVDEWISTTYNSDENKLTLTIDNAKALDVPGLSFMNTDITLTKVEAEKIINLLTLTLHDIEEAEND